MANDIINVDYHDRNNVLHNIYPSFSCNVIWMLNWVILILLNMAPPQKLVLAPSAIFRGNTVIISIIDSIMKIFLIFSRLKSIVKLKAGVQMEILEISIYFLKNLQALKPVVGSIFSNDCWLCSNSKIVRNSSWQWHLFCQL